MGWMRKISYVSGGALLGQHLSSKEEQTARNTKKTAKELKEQNKLIREQNKLRQQGK